MTSPLGPTLGDVFFVYFEKNCLQNCSSDFKPYYYRWFVDDIFFLITLPEYLKAFWNFLNGQLANMSFAVEN